MRQFAADSSPWWKWMTPDAAVMMTRARTRLETRNVLESEPRELARRSVISVVLSLAHLLGFDAPWSQSVSPAA